MAWAVAAACLLVSVLALAAPAGALAPPTCGEATPTIVGTNRADVLVGTPGDDGLDGGPGFDRLNGQAGVDSCANGEVLQRCEATAGAAQPLAAAGAAIGYGRR